MKWCVKMHWVPEEKHRLEQNCFSTHEAADTHFPRAGPDPQGRAQSHNIASLLPLQTRSQIPASLSLTDQPAIHPSFPRSPQVWEFAATARRTQPSPLLTITGLWTKTQPGNHQSGKLMRAGSRDGSPTLSRDGPRSLHLLCSASQKPSDPVIWGVSGGSST